MNKTITGKRNANIEILRVFFMLIILFHHFFSHGLNIGKIGSAALPLNEVNICNAAFHLVTHFGVVGFMFISSYYGINLKISKVCRLWLQLLFYSFFIVLGYSCLTQSFSLGQFFQSLLPLRIWWFCKFYILVMLLSPIINAGIKYVNKNVFEFIIIVLGLILLVSRFILKESSFNLELLLYVYILGRYLKLYPIKWLDNYCSQIFILTSAILFCLPLLLLNYKQVGLLSFLWNNNNILVFAQAISCFYVFLNHKPITLKSIVSSSNILAVYLITDHPIMRDIIWNNAYGVSFYYHRTGSLLIVIMLLMAIFCICIAVDKVRETIISPINSSFIKMDSLLHE